VSPPSAERGNSRPKQTKINNKETKNKINNKNNEQTKINNNQELSKNQDQHNQDRIRHTLASTRWPLSLDTDMTPRCPRMVRSDGYKDRDD
jgi:hypothetical protein